MESDAGGGLSRIFAESWRLLVHNPVLAVPGVILALCKTSLQWAVFPPPGATPLAQVVGIILGDVIQLLFTIAALAFTTGIAVAVWQCGKGRLADGWRPFARQGGQVFVALAALLLIGAVAAVLVPFTLGLSAIAFGFFCLYVMPAAVAGERRGFAAVRESWEIAYDRVLPTLGIVLGLFVIFLAAGIAVAFFTLAPAIGPFPPAIVDALIAGATIAFATLVIVGEYVAARRPAGAARP